MNYHDNKSSSHRDGNRDGNTHMHTGSMIPRYSGARNNSHMYHKAERGFSSAASSCSLGSSDSGRSSAIRELVTQLAQNREIGHGRARSLASRAPAYGKESRAPSKESRQLGTLPENSIVLGKVKWQAPTHDILGDRTPSTSSICSRSSSVSTASVATTVRNFFAEEQRKPSNGPRSHSDTKRSIPRSDRAASHNH